MPEGKLKSMEQIDTFPRIEYIKDNYLQKEKSEEAFLNAHNIISYNKDVWGFGYALILYTYTASNPEVLGCTFLTTKIFPKRCSEGKA